MKRLPIGISDYKKLVEDNYYYIDKTLLIKELIEVGGAITLLPRPRRFGKTLNLSMLRYFFEKSSIDTTHLFSHTAIWQEQEYQKLHAQYPVIFLTFKDVKELTWKNAYEKLTVIIANEFERHAYLLKDLSGQDVKDYQAIMERTASFVLFSRALFLLTELLHNHYQKKVIVLLDEYDAPIHASYTYNYYDEMINFMRSLLTSVLKDNSFLERGVLTGILRAAKEGIFSGLNNLKVCSLTGIEFQNKFGFTQQEVQQLLKDQKLSDTALQVQQWYNGYTFGDTTIYNPWSIVQCADQRGLIRPYWLNTSDNQLIKNLLSLANEDVKAELELLITDQSIIKEIDDAVLFPGIERNSKALWSLLLFSGYLTYVKKELIEGKLLCTLSIPNKEIKILYTDMIKEIFEASLTNTKITLLLRALTEGDSQTFGELLQEFISNSMGIYDFADSDPEKSYHLFVLGLLVYLRDSYEVKSNQESGYGRYDIMLIPKNPNKLGIVVEFKKVSPARGETLEIASQKALDQIQEREYVTELKERGVKRIQLLGIAFQGKKVFVRSIF